MVPCALVGLAVELCSAKFDLWVPRRGINERINESESIRERGEAKHSERDCEAAKLRSSEAAKNVNQQDTPGILSNSQNVAKGIPVKFFSLPNSPVDISSFVDKNCKTRAVTQLNYANTKGSGTVHERSSDLVGKRIFYRYSDVETYEHIYLNWGTFTWHCLRGGEAGLADTEQCKTWKVAQDLYIFFWTEKVMCVEAVLLVDLAKQRSIGRMFGWDDTNHGVVLLPFNSRLSVLNETAYPEDVSK